MDYEEVTAALDARRKKRKTKKRKRNNRGSSSADAAPFAATMKALSNAGKLNDKRRQITTKCDADTRIFDQLVTKNRYLSNKQKGRRIRDFRCIRAPLAKFEIANAEANAAAPAAQAALLRRANKMLVKAMNINLKVLAIASTDTWEDALAWEQAQSSVALGFDDLLPDDYAPPKSKDRGRKRSKKRNRGSNKTVGAAWPSGSSDDASDDDSEEEEDDSSSSSSSSSSGGSSSAA